MKRNTAAIVLGLLLVLCLTAGAGLYVREHTRAAEARSRADAASAHARELEEKVAALDASLHESNRLGEERGREISRLKNQYAELDKQVADFKAGAQRRAPMVIAGGGAALPLGAEIPPEVLKDIGNIQIAPGGFGVGGTITVNGQTIKFGNLKMDDNVKIQIEQPLQQPEAQKKPQEKADEKF